MYKSTLVLIVILFQFKMHLCGMYFENITCTTYDKQFSRFDACELRWIKPKLSSITIKIHLLQPPVTNCDLYGELRFSTSKFSPPQLSSTWDACEFLKNKERKKFFLGLYNLIRNNTNLNHTCPYNHDIHVTDIQLANSRLPLPLPQGQYLLTTNFLVDKKLRLGIDLRVRI